MRRKGEYGFVRGGGGGRAGITEKGKGTPRHHTKRGKAKNLRIVPAALGDHARGGGHTPPDVYLVLAR